MKLIILSISLILSSVMVAKPKVKVACVGNSITYGYGLSDREHEAYPVRLQQLLGDKYEVRNFGHSGCTLLRHGHHPYVSEPEYRAALDFKADIVVIHLGVNDTDPRNWPNYQDEFNPEYIHLIDTLRAVNPKAKVWICLMTPLTFRHHRFLSGTRDWHEQIQAHIRQIAACEHTGLIDLFTPLYDRPDLFYDAVHPNAEGAMIMARTIYAALTGDYGGLQLPTLYGDGMVMQRNRPLSFHGMANAGELVTVTFAGNRRQAKAGEDGKWSVEFPQMPAGGPYVATLSTRKVSKTIREIWIGDVWLCSGQSNMELPVKACTGAKEDGKEAGSQSFLHLFNMPTRYATYQEKWSKAGCDSVDRLQLLRQGPWMSPTAEGIQDFSAVAYHFGRVLADSLQVPIGIICNAVGGTTTESWVDRHTLEWEYPNVLFDWYHGDFGQPWARKRALYNVSQSGAKFPRHPFEPAYMFEAGILPLQHYPLKGVCWYQGESNAHNMETHASLFNLLEKSWRTYFNDPQLPFYTVQLSSLDRPSWPYFRDSQRRLASHLPQTFMVVTSDLGDSLNVHYPNKRPVGIRLAWQALHHTYGHALESEGPDCTGKTFEGDGVRLNFSHAEGLHAQGKQLIGFEVAGEDGVFYPADAEIQGTAVLVRCHSVAHPKTVRYGWQPFTRANLVNGAGLPASTFKI